MSKIHIVVGLDMATVPNEQGVALGRIVDGHIEICKAGVGRILPGALESAPVCLLAIDSPLGWPASMREALCGHRAGGEILGSLGDVFRRATDSFVKREYGEITPLEVGADKIAKTAHAACSLLAKRGIPVVLDSRKREGLSAIEVYPAATLCAHGWSREFREGYKKGKGAREKRGKMVDELKKMSIVFQNGTDEQARDNDDILDACICLLSARDFLDGDCYQPREADAVEAAKIEGWIWVKRKSN